MGDAEVGSTTVVAYGSCSSRKTLEVKFERETLKGYSCKMGLVGIYPHCPGSVLVKFNYITPVCPLNVSFL